MTQNKKTKYGHAILEGFRHLLKNHPDVFLIGQGLWSPWYVGSTMTDLDKEFGPDRVMDSPVSELTCTGAAVGASLCGYRPVVIHPRIDFMILAVDAMVNQAAKWSHMLGGDAHPAVTIRGIVNRGGEQGAQHSQSLHSWFAHIPGIRVVMPATPQDARDLLIASVLCDDPVLYIDDRWLYDSEAELGPITEVKLSDQQPKVLHEGKDITIVASSYSTLLAQKAIEQLNEKGIYPELVDLRVINPLDYETIVESVNKTSRLCVIDGSWENCGLAGEIIAGVSERVDLAALKANPKRITLPASPAPTSKVLESIYYPSVDLLVESIKQQVDTAPSRPLERKAV